MRWRRVGRAWYLPTSRRHGLPVARGEHRRPTPLEAILRGKVSAFDGSEDFLTAVVFSALAWCPPARTWGRILAEATDERGPLGWSCDAVQADVQLWPWWDGSTEANGAEPDVVVRLWDGSGATHVLVIEAKWRSGKSGAGENDQLMRQYLLVEGVARKQEATFLGVLYVTADAVVPTADLEDSRKALRREDAALGWVSWCDIASVLSKLVREGLDEPLVAALARDAERVLERSGLTWFRGVRPVASVPRLAWDLRVPCVVPALRWRGERVG